MISKSSIVPKSIYLLILILVCISCVSRTQTKESLVIDELTCMTFKNKVHNFGDLPSGKSVSAVFEFSNTGENPLLIKDVKTSCGCNVPEWPKEIIEPNESGEIKIVYDAKYPSRFDKTINVVYNGKDSPLQLVIKGQVPYPKEYEKSKFFKNK